MAVLASLVGAARADITYQVEAHPDTGVLHVTMTLPHTDKGSRLQIPNWGPGGYRLNDNFTHVQNLVATDGTSHALKIDTVMETIDRKYNDGVNVCTPARSCTTSLRQLGCGTRERNHRSVRCSQPIVRWIDALGWPSDLPVRGEPTA